MPSPSHGAKQSCMSCGTKYYDLGSKSPRCPKCSTPGRALPQAEPCPKPSGKVSARFADYLRGKLSPSGPSKAGPSAQVAVQVTQSQPVPEVPPRPSVRAPEGDRLDDEFRSAVAAALATVSPVAADPLVEATYPGLPRDLIEALEEERSQYRAVMLRGVDKVRIEEELLAFLPTPAADPDWVGGTVLAFCDNELVAGGEILHIDASTGEAFAAIKNKPSMEALQAAKRWCYKPFDFSEAILGAAKAYSGEGGRLEDCLGLVTGQTEGRVKADVARPTDNGSRGPNRTWDCHWGLIWGPPGTGKTQTVAEAITESVCRLPQRRILAVAPTNRAVDELALRVCKLLAAKGALSRDGACAVFRGGVGAGHELATQFPEALRDETYRQLVEAKAAKEAEIARRETRGASPSEIATLKGELKGLRDRLKDETSVAVQQGSSSVVLLTVHRALRLVSELAGQPFFWKLVLDEGGMIARASAALIAPIAETVLVAGDPKQIGPVSRAAEGATASVRRWLRSSPLGHLHDAQRDTTAENVHLLRVQHRMHPDVAGVVSAFAYAGQLQSGPGPLELGRQVSAVSAYPTRRAAWVVVDECVDHPRDACHDRPTTGRGYLRNASAEMVLAMATPALEAGLTVLAATPYRAQASLLRRYGDEAGLDRRKFVASTIHRQQGAEYDVVILDTVAGGRPFQPNDLTAMLNVVASRARKHLFVLASRAEAQAAIPSKFLSAFEQYRLASKEPLQFDALGPSPGKKVPDFPAPNTLGAEVRNTVAVGPIFTEEQVRLFERKFGDGHQLVRGVAGSGKTFVLAHWASRFLAEHEEGRILVSYFNKALAPLVEKLLFGALVARNGEALARSMLERVTVRNVHAMMRVNEAPTFDAVFVDEAQDMGGPELDYLYRAARRVTDASGRSRRRFYLFADDSQNVYGKQPLEEFRSQTREELSFAGRTRVMKEAFRSTREILDLAFNVVLDPLEVHSAKNPGMREFMKSNELVSEGLLRRPEQCLDGLYHVEYTERVGEVPRVMPFASQEAEADGVAREIANLIQKENLTPSDILVISPTNPGRLAEALERCGIRALAFAGRGGVDATSFPVSDTAYVPVTTVFSAKGHERPVVFFCGVDVLDRLESVLKNLGDGNESAIERAKRSLFYVGATRARVRQYITGVQGSRFLAVSDCYAKQMGR